MTIVWGCEPGGSWNRAARGRRGPAAVVPPRFLRDFQEERVARRALVRVTVVTAALSCAVAVGYGPPPTPAHAAGPQETVIPAEPRPMPQPASLLGAGASGFLEYRS